MKLFERKEKKKAIKEKQEFKEFRCPYCGQIVSPYDDQCPSCMNDLIGKEDSVTFFAFAREIEKYEMNASVNDSKKKEKYIEEIEYLRNFEIPKNKVFMQKLMLYIVNKIEKIKNEELRKAFIAKSIEISNLASVAFPDETFFKEKELEIQAIEKNIKKKKTIKILIIIAVIVAFMVYAALTDDNDANSDELISSSISQLSNHLNK